MSSIAISAAGKPLVARYFGELRVSLVLPASEKAVSLQNFVVNLACSLLTERKSPTIPFTEVLGRIEQFQESPDAGSPREFPHVDPSALTDAQRSYLGELLESFKTVVENAVWTVVAFPGERRAALTCEAVEAVCWVRVFFGVSRKVPSLSPAECLAILQHCALQPAQTFSVFPKGTAGQLFEAAELWTKLVSLVVLGEQTTTGTPGTGGVPEFAVLVAKTQAVWGRKWEFMEAVYKRVFVDKASSLYSEYLGYCEAEAASRRDPDHQRYFRSTWDLFVRYTGLSLLAKAKGLKGELLELERLWRGGEGVLEGFNPVPQLFKSYVASRFFKTTKFLPKSLKEVAKTHCSISRKTFIEKLDVVKNIRSELFLLLQRETGAEGGAGELVDFRGSQGFFCWLETVAIKVDHQLQLACFLYRDAKELRAELDSLQKATQKLAGDHDEDDQHQVQDQDRREY